MDKRFIGTGVAIITPFKDNQVDYNGLTKVIDHVIKGGVDYIVALGSTGEAATISMAEARQILNHVINVVDGRVPIVAGNFAGNDTQSVCDQIGAFDFKGIDAILSSSPAYVKPSQDGIYEHYMAIAKASPVPVILYNVPGRTQSNMNWRTTIRLANDSKNIIGIKEASANITQATKIIQHKPDDFFIVSGDDETALTMVAIGGQGVISVIANALPQAFSTMITSALQGDFKTARQKNIDTFNLHHWLYLEGNPVGIKAAAEVLGICSREVRLPLTKMTETNVNHLREELKQVLK